MAEPRFADDDDLPRTLRRERDARERELREREMPTAAAAHEEHFGGAHGGAYAPAPYAQDYGDGGQPGTVTRLRIPFLHLVTFFLKAVIAAVPALILLTVLLWGMGQGLKAAFPNLLHFQIKIEPMNRP